MRMRHRSKRRLKFNLTREAEPRSSWASIVALLLGTGIFCGALLLALDGKSPSAPAQSRPVGELQHQMPFAITASQSEDLLRGGQALREPAALKTDSFAFQFKRCGARRWSCVVDGDTFWLNGEKIRIADIDTPEVGQPRCREEYVLGVRATLRLIELLNEGEFILVVPQGNSRDRYGRELRIVKRGDVSIGEQLLREGLAHPWDGRRRPWC